MCKVSQPGLSTRRFFNHEGVKNKGVEKNITERGNKSSFSRLGKILKSVFNINIFLKGLKSNKQNPAAQVIRINRISVNNASILRNSLTKASMKLFNGNDKAPPFTPYADDFFRSSKQVPGKLPPPPPPVPNNNSGMTTDRMPSGNTTSITEPFVTTPAQPASRPEAASQSAKLAPPSSSKQPAPPSSPSVSPSMQPASPSMQPTPPLASSSAYSAQLAPPPPPLPAQDFLKYNNALTKRPSNGAGKNNGVMQKEPGSNEQEIQPGGLFNEADKSKMNAFQLKIYKQMQENAAIKAKSDRELAEKKAADKAKKVQQEAQKKEEELIRNQKIMEKSKDGVPLPPPPLPTFSPTEKQPDSVSSLTKKEVDKNTPSNRPKNNGMLDPRKNAAIVRELKERQRLKTQQQNLKTNNDTQ